MYELFELVHVDEAEVWSPIEKLGAVMNLNETPQLGDFMAVHNGVSTFLCRETTRVQVLRAEGGEIQFQVGRGVPNWLHDVKPQLRVTPRGFFLRAQRIKTGDELVYDGLFVTVESPSEVSTN